MGSESDRRRDTDNGLLEGVEGGPIGHALGLFRPVPPPDGVLAVRAPRYLARFPSSAFHRTACAAGCLSCVWPLLRAVGCHSRGEPFSGLRRGDWVGVARWLCLHTWLIRQMKLPSAFFFFSLPLLFCVILSSFPRLPVIYRFGPRLFQTETRL